ncbi:MAG: hypothetical protein FWH42_02895 [Dehalococcoidia bacterium]|nr:hypothetical protein [Dehalococcoidia bacterium]
MHNQSTDYLSTDFKVYVGVNCDYTPGGKIVPRSFVWENGVRYDIDKVLDTRQAASLKAGGAGIRYTVRVNGQEASMYLEEEQGVNRWFMLRANQNDIRKRKENDVKNAVPVTTKNGRDCRSDYSRQLEPSKTQYRYSG